MKICVLSRNSNLYSTRRLVEAAEQRGYRLGKDGNIEKLATASD